MHAHTVASCREQSFPGAHASSCSRTEFRILCVCAFLLLEALDPSTRFFFLLPSTLPMPTGKDEHPTTGTLTLSRTPARRAKRSSGTESWARGVPPQFIPVRSLLDFPSSTILIDRQNLLVRALSCGSRRPNALECQRNEATCPRASHRRREKGS